MLVFDMFSFTFPLSVVVSTVMFVEREEKVVKVLVFS